MSETRTPLVQRLYGLSRPLRRRRMSRFLSLFPTDDILDVGGTDATWRGCSRKVTILNVEKKRAHESAPRPFVLADARDMPFSDSSFEVVYCNSAIEHLGTYDDQAKLARELRRVGRGYWVQTPAKSLPVEPHYLTPFVHWLPLRMRRRVLPYTVWAGITHPSPEYTDETIAELRLVSRGELRRLFPDATIRRERLLGLTKSWLVVRPPAPTLP